MIKFIKQNKNQILLWTYIIIFAVAAFNYQNVFSVLGYVIGLFQPLFAAIGIAFVLNIPMRKIEKNLKKVIPENNFFSRFIRGVAIVITLILAVIFLYMLLVIIVPRIAQSLEVVFTNFGQYIKMSINSLNDIFRKFKIDFRMEDIAAIENLKTMSWNDIFESALSIVGGVADGVVSNAIAFTNTFFDWFLAFCLSIYLLAEKEKFIYQIRKVIVSFCSLKHSNKLFEIGKQANFIFTKFVGGQLVDCAIKGGMFYIVFKLFNFPLPELSSAIITVCNIVPVFGPIFAMIIDFVLIFAMEPITAIWFCVIFQILSNLEAQIIYPKIVGTSIGLPGIWVLFSIFVLGDMMGILGMVLAVPLTALGYSLFSEYVNGRIKKKNVHIVEDKVIEGRVES